MCSFRVVGYSPDGTRRIVDDGPSYAHIQGVGGSGLGTNYMRPVVTAKTPTRPVVKSNHTRYDDKPRCGAPLLIVGEPCYRLPGHRDSHRSRGAMETDNERRRSGWRGTDR